MSQKSKLSKGSPGKRTSFRSSRSQMFFKLGVLKRFLNYTRKRPVLESFFNKLEAWRLSTLISSCPKVFCETGVLHSFVIFIGKPLYWSLFSIRDKDPKACNFFKKGFQHRCFPVNIKKNLRTRLFLEHFRCRFLTLLKTNFNTGVFLWNLQKF